MTHTPGPWRVAVSHSRVIQAEGRRIATAHSHTTQPAAEGDANARLIAAAPDLLAALESMMNVEAAARIGSESFALRGFDWKYHFDKARAAIKAATGDTDLLAAMEPRASHRCSRCGHIGVIVNECGCDPDNLPTRATQ